MELEEKYRIRNNYAYCSGEWSESLGRDLVKNNVTKLELQEDWSDLSCFEGCVDTVEFLKISGAIRDGSIKSINNIHVFKNLKHLTLISKVKKTYDLSSLHNLEYVDAVWQPDFLSVFENPLLKSIILRSLDSKIMEYKGINRSVKFLWLSRPKFESLNFMKLFSGLTELRISNSRNLKSINGLSECKGLFCIDIENATKLADITELEKLKNLEILRLNHVSPEVDLSVLGSCSALRNITVVRSPDLPWELVLPKTSIKKVIGMWTPDVIRLDELLVYLGDGRRPIRIEQDGTKKRPMLILEIDTL